MRVSSKDSPDRGASRRAPSDPRAGGRRLGGRGLGFWIAIALLLHAELVLLLGVGLYLFAPRNADLARNLAASGGPEQIDIGMVDEDAAREIVADLERQEEARKAEEARKEEESPHPQGQIVELPIPREEKRPDDAHYLSEHDSTVTHETKKLGRFEDNARQGDVGGTASVAQPKTAPGDGRLAMRTPDLGRFLRGPGNTGAAAQVGRAGAPYGAFDPGRPEPEGSVADLGANAQPRTGGGASPGGSGLTLMPSEQQLARAVGGGTQDALRDVDDGEETALNSKKWRFASFFNRVKRQVAEHWHPEDVYRQRDPTGAIYGHRNRYTFLRVELKPDGRLNNLRVAEPSGLEFLDDEALEAFREAAPFPNPPHQLVEANGLINFGFGFLLDLNGAPQMQWFRY